MESKVFVKTLLLWSLILIEIQDVPLLSFASVVTPDLNGLAFFVLASSDVKDFAALPVDELVVLILEDLPPSRVGAPDLHVVGSSGVLDIE
jgi:hypothetical protein